jgi:hypothetical protein
MSKWKKRYQELEIEQAYYQIGLQHYREYANKLEKKIDDILVIIAGELPTEEQGVCPVTGAVANLDKPQYL